MAENCVRNSVVSEVLGKDGIETTKEILKINPDIKIVFASADGAVRDDALASGACDFLSKPFTIGDLLAEIEKILAE